MSLTKKDISMGFTTELFPETAHICLIFDNEKQRRKIVSEYLAAGLRQGELVRYVSDGSSPEEIRSWLLEMGVGVPQTKESSLLGIVDAEKFYCPTGQFEPQRLIDGMVPRFEQAKRDGYRGSRVCGEMTWSLRGISGSERLLEYEVLLSAVADPYPHTGMCQYDARLFDGATLFKVLQVHPYMVAQGQIVRNPFYARPEEFSMESKSGA